jgi:hypothetical protein
MDRITITINTENSAFTEEDFYMNAEVSRILHDLADKIENDHYPSKLRDLNGNTCGKVEIE